MKIAYFDLCASRETVPCLCMVLNEGEETMPTAPQPVLLWPFVVYGLAIVMLVASMLTLSALLGQKHRDSATGEPYESGVVVTGTARLRLSAHFYLVAMFFVIFDLEAVFIVAWAVAAREVGWPGYVGVVIFIGVLVVALLYEWRLGALDWVSQARRGNGRAPRATTRQHGARDRGRGSALSPTGAARL
jgi:NADH-quinone oxidoreductase subunit A